MSASFPLPSPLLGLKTFAFTSSIFMSGIQFCCSQLTIPLLYDLPAGTAAAVFDKFYHSGALVVVPLSAISAVASAAVAFNVAPDKRDIYLLAAATTLGTLPWTALFMASTNKRLLEINAREKDRASKAEVLRLINTWKWMNMVRVGLGAAGGLIGVYALLN